MDEVPQASTAPGHHEMIGKRPNIDPRRVALIDKENLDQVFSPDAGSTAAARGEGIELALLTLRRRENA